MRIEPERYVFVEDIESCLRRFVRETIQRAAAAEACGEGGGLIYTQAALDLIGLSPIVSDAITRRMDLRNHVHRYDDSDYCLLCGGDGRT